MIGIVQEQHPDRARLYKQWRQLNWPILVDSLNLLGLRAVPKLVALDESGVVRASGLRSMDALTAFLEEEYPHVAPPEDYEELSHETLFYELPPPGKIKKRIGALARKAGHLSFRLDRLDDAVRNYRSNLSSGPSATGYFRLGVVLRRRSESDKRQPHDAQDAVDAWTEALQMEPNQYIWRRRLQQYGPRLDKPYNFYSWVAQARKDIRARGEEPVALVSEPAGSEIAAPARGPTGAPVMKDLDPEDKIHHDDGRIQIESLATPRRVRPGSAVRVRLRFRVDAKTKPYWNNEADGLQLYVQVPEGCVLREGVFDYPLPKQAETQEDRLLEFELTTPAKGSGALELQGYALYDVCDKEGGTCLRLRQDFNIALTLDPEAPTLK
ncbi:MAG: hypothetical protein O7C98_15240 [Planctomycetota bacterium]|nr:hypothetical protein [Planctomycetota bacterium]